MAVTKVTKFGIVFAILIVFMGMMIGMSFSNLCLPLVSILISVLAINAIFNGNGRAESKKRIEKMVNEKHRGADSH